MVEKEKRAEAEKLIDALFLGHITNYEYDDRFPRSERDPALRAIYEALWFIYSDVREHRLNPQKLKARDEETLVRIQLFLRSDDEYTGPRKFTDLLAIPKRVWCWVTRRPQPSVPEFWPFENESQFRNARLNLHRCRKIPLPPTISRRDPDGTFRAADSSVEIVSGSPCYRHLIASGVA